MNFKIILRLLGQLLLIEGVALILSLMVLMGLKYLPMQQLALILMKEVFLMLVTKDHLRLKKLFKKLA